MFGIAEEALGEELAELTGQPWGVEDTGGGCTALMWHIAPNYAHYLMVTHSEDASVPDPLEPVCLGEYFDGYPESDLTSVGEMVGPYWYFTNRDELVKFLKVWALKREGAI